TKRLIIVRAMYNIHFTSLKLNRIVVTDKSVPVNVKTSSDLNTSLTVIVMRLVMLFSSKNTTKKHIIVIIMCVFLLLILNLHYIFFNPIFFDFICFLIFFFVFFFLSFSNFLF